MKKNTLFLVLLLVSIVFSSCRYDFILPEEVPVIDNGGEPVSFATQIAPIFSAGEKCTACHKPGATAPDLTAASAYAQISSKYINLASPETSGLLTTAGPTTSAHAWKKLSQGESALILAWIKEGAKNN